MRIPNDIYSEYSLSRIHSDWAVIAGNNIDLDDREFRGAALSFARQIMRRARAMFSQIVQSLDDAGYRFVFPDEVLVPPEPEAADWIATYRERSVHIPIALEAWCLEVGSINLMGSHPDWGQSGYAFENRSGEYPLITDPFVCELSASYIDYLYDEWLSTDSEDRDPFRLDISPDHLHKANISGGPPYKLDTYKPEVDPLVFNQRFCASLVGSIRYAIRWRGFPGFEYIANKEPWSTIGPAEI